MILTRDLGFTFVWLQTENLDEEIRRNSYSLILTLLPVEKEAGKLKEINATLEKKNNNFTSTFKIIFINYLKEHLPFMKKS